MEAMTTTQAMIMSTEEDVLAHGYVLYGLVKPRKEGVELMLESTKAMVNVLPRKRIYRMESVEELETFRAELLKRPLVVQPIVHAGSGIQRINCSFCLRRVNWVLMINQTHPKILGRILMGIDAAKRVMERGEPFILEYSFSDILKRLYFDVTEKGSRSPYKYMDCQYGDLLVRYGGDETHQGVAWEMKARHIRFAFEDLNQDEVTLRTLEKAQRERQDPRLIVIPKDVIKRDVVGWTFEDEVAEEQQYSYESYKSAGTQEQASREHTGRIRGRSNRNQPSSKYEVRVDLHVPENKIGETSFNENTRQTNKSENHTNYGSSSNGSKFIHTHQGSGRSGSSSVADSGYDGDNDHGGFDSGRYNNYVREQKSRFPPDRLEYTAKSQYDNYAYDNHHDKSPDMDVVQKNKDLAARKIQQSSNYNDYPPSYREMSRGRDTGVSYGHEIPNRQFQTIEQMNAKLKTTNRELQRDESVI